MTELVLRSARPTPEDGRLFARYLDQAAGGMFRWAIGAGVEGVLARAFLDAGHDLSHEHVTFAKRGEAVVGMVSAYTADQHALSSDGPLLKAAGLRVVRMALVAGLAFRLLRFLDRVDPGDCYLQAVAVDEGQRGNGIGSRLIRHVEAAARRQGCARLSLDVALENEGARKLYGRMGMTEGATSPGVLFAPEARVVRMVKALDPAG